VYRSREKNSDDNENIFNKDAEIIVCYSLTKTPYNREKQQQLVISGRWKGVIEVSPSNGHLSLSK
jgi:hypothetical protein